MREARETFSPEWARASKSGAVEPLVSAGIAGVTQQSLLWTSVGRLAVGGRPTHTHAHLVSAARAVETREKTSLQLARSAGAAPRAPPTVQVFPQLGQHPQAPSRRVESPSRRSHRISPSAPLFQYGTFADRTWQKRSSETYIVRTARRAFGSDSLPRCRASKLSGAGWGQPREPVGSCL